MSPTKSLWLAALLAVALPGAALATVVVSATIEEMTQAVPVVVRATVGQTQVGWDAEHQRIWTWAELKVTESLKGDITGTLLVKQPGGEVGGIGQHVSGVARFTQGQDTVLFLEPAKDEAGTFVVYALAAGKVDLEQQLGQQLAVRHLGGLVLMEKGRGQVRPVGEGGERLGSAEAFLTRVRTAVKGGAR